METQHECTVQEAGWRLLADCPEDGAGGSVVAIVVGVVVLGLIGVGVWYLIKKRA